MSDEAAGPCPNPPQGFGLQDLAPARILAAARCCRACRFRGAACFNQSCQLRVGELRLRGGWGAGAIMTAGGMLQFPHFSGWQRQRLPYLHKERGQIRLLRVSSECAPPCPHLLCEACCQGEGSLPDIPAEDSMPHGVLPRGFRVVYLGRQCFPGGVVESEYVGEGRCPREALPDTVSTSRIVGWDTGQGPMQQEARPRVFLSHFFVSL